MTAAATAWRALSAANSVLVLVDIQGKLASLMHGKESLFLELQRLVRGAIELELPIILLEQNPDGMGPTIPELTALLTGHRPIPKFAFSCCGDPGFMRALESSGRKQVLLAGIETHVCIYQTAADLVAAGYDVQVVGDAVSSRTAANREIGFERIRALGAAVTSVEMALFEMLRTAKNPHFKGILRLVK